MQIRLLSDLHIEIHPFTIPALDGEDNMVLVLAGDIGKFNRREPLEQFLAEACDRFRAVIYVAGNHEFYGSLWPEAQERVDLWGLPENFHLLERRSVKIDDVTFLGATLWTDFEKESPFSLFECQRYINDFNLIRMREGGGSSFLPHDALKDHYQSRLWIAKKLRQLRDKGEKTVLVTHHGVSLQSISPQFKGDSCNGAFVSDLSEILESSPPLLALHGHVHQSFDYLVNNVPGGTRVVTNPRGYARTDLTQENKEFDPLLVIEI